MKISQILLPLLFIGAASTARADFLIDPHVGYETGTFTAHVKLPPQDVNATDTDISAGIRLGYKFMPGFWIAVDPQFGFSGQSKSDNSSSSFTRTQIYGDLGYDFSMVRAYVGYAALNEWKFDSTKYSGGTALKVGASVRVLSDVAINAEYHMNGYKTVADNNGNSANVSDVYDNFKDNTFVVGLSFPFGMGSK